MAMSKLAKDQLKFVDSPTDEFNCPICLGILQEPYLTACCGNHFCEACIEKVKEGANKCPLCQETPLNGIINKGLRRKLNELKVYCMHKETGCKWIGDLGKLEQHLAIGKNDGECQFVMVKCTISDLCKVKILRNALNNHTNNVCQYRQFRCEHCGYQSTYLVITTEHYDQCPDYPVLCPNNCSKQTHPRGQLDAHLTLCPEQEVDCTFSEMGCKEKLKRRQLQQHLTTNSLQHQMIMCQAYRLQNETIALLQQDKQKLEEQVACLTKDMKNLQTLMSTREINWPLYLNRMSLIASVCPVAPIILEIPFKVMQMSSLFKRDDFHSFAPTYNSPPFYSYHSGYKLQLSAKFAYQDSKAIAEYLEVFLDTTVSLVNKVNGKIYCVIIDLYIMDGEYDDHLKWPFEKEIIITRLNKQTDHEVEKCFKGNKASQLELRDSNITKTEEIKQEYEQLLKKKGLPTQVQSELMNMYYDVLKTVPRNIPFLSNSLLFLLDEDSLTNNKESKVYFGVAFND